MRAEAKPSPTTAPPQAATAARGLSASHWVVVAASLALTLVAWYITADQEQQKRTSQFDRHARHIIELVRERLRKYEDTLWAGAAAIHTHAEIPDASQWRVFSRSLSIESKYPGVNGIGVILRVPRAGLEGFLRDQRALRPGFQIHPPHPGDELWPITYIEPSETNRQAVGLDMAHEERRFRAAQQSRDSGHAQITAPIVLVQDNQQTPGFLQYVPFYTTQAVPESLAARREAFVGLVYAPFIVEQLMSGVLQNQNRLVNFAIRDGSQLLYDELRPTSADYDPDPLLRQRFEIDLYGRRWSFEVQASNLFRVQYAGGRSLIILVAGLVIDLLLLIVFMVLGNSNKRALAYADRATRELRESVVRSEALAEQLERQNTALQHSNEELDRFAYVASHDLKAPLGAIERLGGWIEEDCAHLLPEDSKRHLETMRGRVQRLARLLDDLLLYSRAGRTPKQNEAIQLAGLVQDISRMMDVPAGFSVRAPEVSIHAPRQALEQVIRNLIGNAVKHHDRGAGEIDIEIQQDPHGFTMTVSDDGPGIPTELRSKALEMFQTLHPRDEREGSGMGLSLCKKILDSFGGQLRIETARLGGTAVVSHWPIPQPPGPHRGAQRAGADRA